MICTSNYKNMNINGFKNVSISGDHGLSVNYYGERFSKLAPKKDFWNVWHDNIGKIPVEQNNKFYIEHYYKEVLASLDAGEIYQKLDDSLLLCYEDHDAFCHRHIASAWFELVLDIKVNELKKEDDHYVIIKRLNYIKEYLNEVMTNNLDMNGFSSIHALYMYRKGGKMIEDGKMMQRKACSYDFDHCKKYVKK